MTKDLTSGPPARLILFFALPLLVGNLFQQLYAFADALVVGRTLGLDALAAVGATGGVTFLLIGFSAGLTNGFAIPIARAFGAGDAAGVRRSAMAGLYLSVIFSLALTAVAVPLSRPLLVLLETPAGILDDSTTFLVVTFAGCLATVLFNYLSNAIRALGDSKTPLIFLAVASVLNIGLVVLFVGQADLGVGGAAGATILAQLATVIACCVLVLRRMPALVPQTRREWAPHWQDMREPMHVGVPMGFQMSIIAVGALVLQYAINGLGTEAVAAFTAASRVDQLAVAPLQSFGLAIVTFVAQNRGAGQWTRIRQGVARTCAMSIGLAIAVGAVCIVGGPAIVRGFAGADADADAVVDMAHTYLIISGFLYSALALLFVFRNALQGMGKTAVPTMSGVMDLALRMVAALVLVSHFGFLGACLAAPLAWFGALVPLWPAWAAQRRELAHMTDGVTAFDAPSPDTETLSVAVAITATAPSPEEACAPASR